MFKFLFLTTALLSADTSWTAEDEAALSNARVNATPTIQQHTVMIGRLGLLEVRPAVLLNEKGDLLAPHLVPIDEEDETPYLLYRPDGSREAITLISEKEKIGLAHLRLENIPEGLVPAPRAEDDLLTQCQWFLFPINAPIPHRGEPFAIASDHAFPRAEDDATSLTLARLLPPSGTPVFDPAGRLAGLQTKTRRTSRVLLLNRVLELFPNLANSPADPVPTNLPELPFAPEKQNDEFEESPLSDARDHFAASLLPSTDQPYALVRNVNKALTHSAGAIIVRADGLLISKASELSDALAVLHGGKNYPAALLAIDEATDLALIGIEATGLPVIQWASPVNLTSGQSLISPILVKTSGGEMTTGPGAVAGCFSHLLSGETPTIHATSSPAGLGLITEQIRNELRIASFQKERPSSALETGDLLLKLNNHPLTNRSSLTDALTGLKVGQSVKLTIERKGEMLVLDVPLARPHLTPPPTGISPTDELSFIPSIRRFHFPEVIVHTLPLDSWDCGTPLFTKDGKAVGINIASVSQARSVALTPKVIRTALRRLLTKSLTF